MPFILDVDVASGLFDLTAEDFLEKKAVLTVWQGNICGSISAGDQASIFGFVGYRPLMGCS